MLCLCGSGSGRRERRKVGKVGRKETKVANFGGRLGFMFDCLSSRIGQDIWMTRERTQDCVWPPSQQVVASFSLA